MDAERLLLLETSSRSLSLAVAEGGRVLGQRVIADPRRNARDLAPLMAELLVEQGWAPRSLRAVAAGTGPGSYTGLRVGVMAAKAFAFATGCALVGVPSFAIVAEQAPPRCQALDVLADAQKEHAYIQSFDRTSAGWAGGELEIRKVEDWLATRRAGAWASGPGLLKHLVPGPLCDEADRMPRAASMLPLALARLRAGLADDPLALVPLYLRPSAAEMQWTALGK